MNKLLGLLKYIFIMGLGITTAVFVLYLLAAKNMDFNFANNGHIICVNHRDYGLFDKGDLTCFAVTPLNSGIDQLTQKVQTLSPNGEIILKK